MEEIFTNSGFHYIAQKILKHLHNESNDFQTLLTLSQTNKEIMRVCELFIMTKEQENPIFENLKCQSCEEVFIDLFQDFISFVKENEIFYSRYFHFLKNNNKQSRILIRFLEKLSKLKGVNIFEIKHEYLRSRAYICLSLSSPFSSVMVSQLCTLYKILVPMS